MSCDDNQKMISKLIDGEVLQAESAAVFGHLAECTNCRGFYDELQKVSSSLDRLADAVPEGLIREFRPPSFPSLMRPQTLWSRRIPLRLPVLALLVCVILASFFMSFSTETVYVTKLPTTVVTAELSETNPKN
jgi:predicted anti-sigma-YlaC factor YlaD